MSITLVVWHKNNKRLSKKCYKVSTEQEAHKLARNDFKGLRTKVIGGRVKPGNSFNHTNIIRIRGGY